MKSKASVDEQLLAEDSVTKTLVSDALAKWAKQTNYQRKKELAASLLVDGWFGELWPWTSVSEKDVQILENIIALSRTGLEGKFYRDHLVHAIRVMLLAEWLAKKFGLDDDQLNACAFAGLQHDVGLPLSYSKDVMESIHQTLGYIYHNKLQFEPRSLIFNFAGKELLRVAKDEGEGKHLQSLLDASPPNHGVLGALELLKECEVLDQSPDDSTLSICRAVALHDSEVKLDIQWSQDKIAFILVLADELQEWGRPIGATLKTVTNSIGINYRSNTLNAHLDFSTLDRTRGRLFSPLLSIIGKAQNLGRLVLDSRRPCLRIVFRLPIYSPVNINGIYELARHLIGMAHLHTFEFFQDSMIRFAAFKRDLETRPRRKMNMFFNEHTGEIALSSLSRIPRRIAFSGTTGRVACDYDLVHLDGDFLDELVTSSRHDFRKHIVASKYPLVDFDETLHAAFKRHPAIHSGSFSEDVAYAYETAVYFFHLLDVVRKILPSAFYGELSATQYNALSEITSVNLGYLDLESVDGTRWARKLDLVRSMGCFNLPPFIERTFFIQKRLERT